MCEYCNKDIHLEIKRPGINRGEKFDLAVESLQKALGYDSERQQKEISPFQSVRDLEKMSKDRVERLLLKLYNELSKWFVMEKAAKDTYMLNGRFFIDPKSGKPLEKHAVFYRHIPFQPKQVPLGIEAFFAKNNGITRCQLEPFTDISRYRPVAKPDQRQKVNGPLHIRFFKKKQIKPGEHFFDGIKQRNELFVRHN